MYEDSWHFFSRGELKVRDSNQTLAIAISWHCDLVQIIYLSLAFLLCEKQCLWMVHYEHAPDIKAAFIWIISFNLYKLWDWVFITVLVSLIKKLRLRKFENLSNSQVVEPGFSPRQCSQRMCLLILTMCWPETMLTSFNTEFFNSSSE